jgi:hypothetical protein
VDADRADLDALLGALARDPRLERRLLDEPATVLAEFELTADELRDLDRRLRCDEGPRLDELFTTRPDVTVMEEP